jgi:glycosyltransferase involved in cell wall biosynthesis
MKQSQPKSIEELKVLTWHVHGSYLYYLTQVPCQWYLPYKEDAPGYGGRAGAYAWGDNVHQIAAEDVADLDLDLIIFQSKRNYLDDQYTLFTEPQRTLPRLYLEHDPPRKHATDTKHIVGDPNVGIVHVTHFNQLMWDSNTSPTYVVDHGVLVPDDVRYTGELEKGIVVINNLHLRGRRLGLDIFERVREEIPLDLIGMGATELNSVGEIPHNQLPEFISRYRFFFNPIRYTSLGLAVLEAMMIGLPIVGLATTEMAMVFQNGKNGFVHTDVDRVIEHMRDLLADRNLAERISRTGRSYALQHHNIDRFVRDWCDVMLHVTQNEQAESRANGFHRERVVG